MPKAAPVAMTELKLIALDEEDLAVVSSLLQDAVVRVGDMTYLPSQKRFAAVLNRFDWEKAAKATGGKDYRRRRTALRFDRVFGAKLKNVKPGQQPRAVAARGELRAERAAGRPGHAHLLRRRLDPAPGRMHRGRAQGSRARLAHALQPEHPGDEPARAASRPGRLLSAAAMAAGSRPLIPISRTASRRCSR